MEQRLSPEGRKFIKHYEQLTLTAERDGKNGFSIGWGHYGPDVTEGMKITRQKADQLFAEDIQEFEGYVRKLIHVPLNQKEFDALVSFVYNIGPTKFKNESGTYRRLNLGERIPAADHMRRWNKQDGVVQGGLVKRRAAEKALFLGESYEKAIKAGEEAYASFVKGLQTARH